MVEINRENKTITFRVLFAGPPGAGKRTTFHSIHSQVSPTIRTEIVDINEGVGKLLSFDLIPLALGRSDFNSRLRLQTTCEVDGCANLLKELSPVFDGIIFIADSDPEKAQLNLEVLNYLEGVPFLSKIPLLLQFNKRDLLDAVSVEQMVERLSANRIEFFETVATEGSGVFAPIKALHKKMLEQLELSQ